VAPSAGWVARLFSGETEQEIRSYARNINRLKGIHRFIAGLDRTLFMKQHGTVGVHMAYWRQDIFEVNRYRCWSDDPTCLLLAQRMLGAVAQDCFIDPEVVISDALRGDLSSSIRHLKHFVQNVVRLTIAWAMTAAVDSIHAAKHLIQVWLIQLLNPNSVLSVLGRINS
jgi:hypothetical protein